MTPGQAGGVPAAGGVPPANGVPAASDVPAAPVVQKGVKTKRQHHYGKKGPKHSGNTMTQGKGAGRKFPTPGGPSTGSADFSPCGIGVVGCLLHSLSFGFLLLWPYATTCLRYHLYECTAAALAAFVIVIVAQIKYSNVACWFGSHLRSLRLARSTSEGPRVANRSRASPRARFKFSFGFLLSRTAARKQRSASNDVYFGVLTPIRGQGIRWHVLFLPSWPFTITSLRCGLSLSSGLCHVCSAEGYCMCSVCLPL